MACILIPPLSQIGAMGVEPTFTKTVFETAPSPIREHAPLLVYISFVRMGEVGFEPTYT